MAPLVLTMLLNAVQAKLKLTCLRSTATKKDIKNLTYKPGQQ